MNGKGDTPRNCFTKQYKNNYDQIDWKKIQSERPGDISPCGKRKQAHVRYHNRDKSDSRLLDKGPSQE